jgi:hypothetical protein
MRPWNRAQVLAAAVAAAAFLLYRSTMLPGLELGDSASFQTMAGENLLTPRDGYPLYYALAKPFVWVSDNHAAAMNLVSAAEGGVAIGIIAMLAGELAGSRAIGAAVAIIFGGSYTFWSQAIIAEVYALHVLLSGVSMWLLLRWGHQPTDARLAAFFFSYAVAFGNHLSMILFLPAFAVYILATSPGGWRALLTKQVAMLAGLAIVAGALPYTWNLSGLWLLGERPAGLVDAFRTFWFDVTKSDWRDTMVLRVPAAMAADRLRMYWFDLVQQFGAFIPAVSVVGTIVLFRTDRPRAALLLIAYAATTAFALGYNVGDAHVFFLPSHMMLVLLSAPGWRWLDLRLGGTGVAVAGAIAIAALRIHADYPALDRSTDWRPTEALRALTDGLDDGRTVLLTDLNWQLQNGLTYYTERERPEIVTVRMTEVLLYAPALIKDNLDAGRRIVLTDRARRSLAAAYGPLLDLEADPASAIPALADLVARLPAGTVYVLSLLAPSPEFELDRADLARAVDRLSGGRAVFQAQGQYAVMAGVVGRLPEILVFGDNPFRATARVNGIDIQVRIDAWLEFDTIRRMGFGHVIAGRSHAQILERGLNFVAMDANAHPRVRTYRAGIFAPQPRFIARRVRLGMHAIVDP